MVMKPTWGRLPTAQQWLYLTALRVVRGAFERAGWKVEQNQQVDLMASKGQSTYLVEIRTVREQRLELLEGQLALAILHSQQASKRLRGIPLAVVAAQNLSDVMADALKALAQRYSPDVAVGLVDAAGRFELHGEGLESVAASAVPPEPGLRKGARNSSIPGLFSDCNQWLLKVLLAPRFSESLLGAPDAARKGPILSPAHLAKIAEVSLPTSSRFVLRAQEDGFLTRTRGALELIRLDELFERWKGVTSISPIRELRARWIIPPQHRQYETFRVLRENSAVEEESGLRVCLGLFAAADLMRLSFVSGAPEHLCARSPDSALLEKLGLRPAEPAEGADVFVRTIDYPHSTMRAAILHKGVPGTDVIQTWLDVWRYPARGPEQAEHLWKKAIAPAIKGRSDE